MHEVVDAFTSTREGSGNVSGRLRVAAPILFSQLAMGRLCAEFRALYPEVMVEVVAEDRVVNLVDEQFDVAIRPNPRADSALVGRCFAKDRMVVVAAPTVAMPRPGKTPVRVPAVVSVFREGDCWSIGGSGLVVEPVPVLRLSSMLMLRDAALAGAGVTLIPQSIAAAQIASGKLVEWGTVGAKDVELWVLHTSRRLASPKVKAFVDFMVSRFPDGYLSLGG
jgi:DNA-binding transcriptional LysR family regulator